MSKRGLPATVRMRHDEHYVERSPAPPAPGRADRAD